MIIVSQTDNSKLNIAHSASSAIPLHLDTSEFVVCIYGYSIDRFYYEQCNETEMVAMKTGRDTSGIIMNKWLIIQIDIKCWH